MKVLSLIATALVATIANTLPAEEFDTPLNVTEGASAKIFKRDNVQFYMYPCQRRSW
jgi:hypothetical protein